MELRGRRRANKPQSGLFTRHYYKPLPLSLSNLRRYFARFF